MSALADDASGAWPPAEDTCVDAEFQQPFAITIFASASATRKAEEQTTLSALADRIRTTQAPAKSQLPWLKLARFGDRRTTNHSLRHDANVEAITGVELDYDGGVVPVDDAEGLLLKSGVLSLLYTSASHTADAPRWRVLCPTSAELPPAQRKQLMGRLNGVLRGAASSESWTLSQSYYFGRVANNTAHDVRLIPGAPIDLLDELDQAWWGKADTKPGATTGSAADRPPRSGPIDEQALIQQIIAGASYHAAYVRLLGRWARDGVPMMEARSRLQAAMEAVPEAARDDRWQARYADIDRCLEDIYVKEADKRDAGASLAVRPAWQDDPGYRAAQDADAESQGPSRRRRSNSADTDDIIWPEPVDFLANDDITGTVELRREHLPDAIADFVFDTATRMGVDPSTVALAALVSCASVVSDDWQIQPKRHDTTWTESPRIWGAIVGDPSILKSPVLTACTRPIDQLEIEARKQHAAAMIRYTAELNEWKKEKRGEEPKHPVLDRYLVESLTVEALSEVLRDDFKALQCAPAGKVLVRSDELSELLGNLDRYNAGGRGGGDRGAFLRLYNGGRHTVDRVSRGAFACPSWSACLLGGIQPGPIQKIAREAADDGMLQRFIYAVPARQDSGLDQAPDRAAINRYHALFPALRGLNPVRSGGHDDVEAVRFHADAHQYREALDDLTRAMQMLPDTTPRLKAALGKFSGRFARIALLFHLIEIGDCRARGVQAPPLSIVAEDTARRAQAYLRDIVLPHLLRADALMFLTPQTGHARWIAGFILSRGVPKVMRRDITRAYRALRAPEAERELTSVMAGLEAMGWVLEHDTGNLARSPTAWLVNPKVHTVFAARAEQERSARIVARERLSQLHRTGQSP